MIDIGNIIRDYCYSHKHSLPALAKSLNISHSTLYNSLNSNSISLQRLSQISSILNHNFFIHFIQNTGASEEQLLKLTTENRELTSKVASLQKEITYLQEIISLLKANSRSEA
jgi:transcriptional regulator with XRE-family HTH domain